MLSLAAGGGGIWFLLPSDAQHKETVLCMKASPGDQRDESTVSSPSGTPAEAPSNAICYLEHSRVRVS